MDGTSRPTRRWRAVLALCIAVPFILAVTFFVSMQMLARDQATRLGLPGSKNSIQHAYAAAETYAWLRMLGLGKDSSVEVVIRLGYLNEVAENRILRIDGSTAEIYKDLNNNYSGLLTAAWLELCTARGPTARLLAIGALAKENAIFYFANDKRIPTLPRPPDLSAAIAQFELDRDAISSRLNGDLQRIVPACTPANLG
jgi:hypothetical protein